MSRPRRRSGPPSRPPGGATSGGGRRGRLAVALLVVVGAVAAITLLLRPRTPAPGGAPPAPTADERVILDSLKASDQRRDWVSTLLWVERLGRLRPRDHGVLLARGTAWSNYAVDQRPSRVFPRPALRTSLERVECLRRAVGLMDSSSQVAGDRTRWLDSGERLAQLFENLGLPGDALIAYETMKQREPDAMSPAMRAYWLRALFYDPVNPDTSAYRERMRSLGLR